MGLDLYWKPEEQGERLPDELKWALEKGGWHFPRTVEVNSMDDGILEGMRLAGVKGAEEIITALRLNRRIILTKE